MAMILKKDEVYEDRFGNCGNQFFMVIENVYINKIDKLCDINVRIYSCEDAYKSNKQFVERETFSMDSDEYNEWCKISSLGLYDDIYNMSYTFLTKKLVKWTRDE